MQGPKVSVVIPYYNNDRTFLRCLKSFANEQSEPPHEIVIVDDGSARPAAPIIEEFVSSVPIRLVQGDHGGQSRASNIGVRAAEGDVVLLSCADIVANETFVQTHRQEHAQARARGESLVVLGHIAYPPWVPMTPFMEYLSNDGPQFCFGTIKDAERVDGALLYSPNFSVERSWMRRLGGYDELFPYGFQDTDLGIRFGQAGLRMVYRKKAYAHHDHPNDLPSFVRRNRSIGQYMHRMCRRHPSLFVKKQARYSLSVVGSTPTYLCDLLAATLRFEAAYLRAIHPSAAYKKKLFDLYEQVLSVAFYEGAIEGDESLGPLLDYHPEDWARVRARAPASPMQNMQVAS